MKKQSIIQAILNAIDETDGSIAKHMNQLIKWSKYCEKSIGSMNAYPYKSALFTLSGAILDQPDDCYRVHSIFFGNYTDKLNLKYLDDSNPLVSVDNVYNDPSDQLDVEHVYKSLNEVQINRVLWEEIGDKISFANEYSDQQVTVVYQYIETDPKGYWIVNDSHIEAITRYLKYKIASKYLFKNFKSSKMTRANDMQMVELYRRDYNIAIRNARAEDNKESNIDTTNGWRYGIK